MASALSWDRPCAKGEKCMPPEGTSPGDPREWLRRARSNLARSSQGQVAPDVLFEDACFNAQQAVEKALEALLVLRGVPGASDACHQRTDHDAGGVGIRRACRRARAVRVD